MRQREEAWWTPSAIGVWFLMLRGVNARMRGLDAVMRRSPGLPPTYRSPRESSWDDGVVAVAVVDVVVDVDVVDADVVDVDDVVVVVVVDVDVVVVHDVVVDGWYSRCTVFWYGSTI